MPAGRCRGSAAILAVCVALAGSGCSPLQLGSFAGTAGSSAQPVVPLVSGRYVTVRAATAEVRPLAVAIAARVDYLHRTVGRDFGTQPGQLRVTLYATHGAYVRALSAGHYPMPQSTTDDTASILRGRLLLGPERPPYLWHNLAHVYTEWVLDRLTANRGDALPPNPWLYDGVAEYEAYRYAPAGMPCAAGRRAPFDVTHIRTPRRWLALRSGPAGPLEYCLAFLRVRSIVGVVGWSPLVRALAATRHPWTVLAPRLARLQQSTMNAAVHERRRKAVGDRVSGNLSLLY